MTESSQRDIVRKKFSLTKYHDGLLDEIVEQRYASRSEAIRATIQHHAQYLSDGGGTDIEVVKNRIDHLEDEIRAVGEKIDERDQVVQVAGQVSDEAGTNQQSNADPEVEKLIAEELNKAGSLPVDKIIKKTGQDVISVIPAIESMKKREIIRSVENGDGEYKLNT
jgi:hypothetical protein